MTLQNALREQHYMKEIRGFDEVAFSKQALIIHIKQIFKEFEEERPSKRRVQTNLVIPETGLPKFRSYMDVLEFFKTNTRDRHGNALTFEFEGKTVKVSLKGELYYSTKDGTPDMGFDDSQRFLKTLYNYKHLLEAAIKG